jgi:hypothetical protein
MVLMDDKLMESARRCATGANIKLAKELIYFYFQAVLLHNAGNPRHVVYNDMPEKKLREFVEKSFGSKEVITYARRNSPGITS